MRRSVIFLIALSLIATSCGRGDEPQALTSTTSLPPTVMLSTTSQVTTTGPTSTTELARVVVTTNLNGGIDQALNAAIASVYEAALNPGQQVFATIPRGLRQQFAQRTPTSDGMIIEGDVHVGRILDTDIAVAEIGEDIVLLAGQAEEGRWEIVGAKLTSLGEPAWYGDGPLEILVIGSDARPGQKVSGFRADSVHIISAVPATRTASIVGIPRDSWVEVPYEGAGAVGGMDKLTHTMASRGPEVVVETVTTLSGVEFDGYLLTGFLGFQRLIDAFGGFQLDVPYRMNDIKSFSNFSPGVQHMTGTEALAFSRNRANAPGGDFGRSLNHGRVMKAVLTEMKQRGSIEQIPMLLTILLEFIETDLTAAQLLILAATTFELDPDGIANIVVPGITGWRSGRNVVLLDDEAHEIFADIAQDGILTVSEDEG